MKTTQHFDLAVVGGGPAGLSAACLAGVAGLRTAFWPGPERAEDLRTTALMLPAIKLLEHVGVWTDDLKADCAPLARLQIRDATGRRPAAPTVTFEAHEIGQQEFGWNVPVAPLVSALTDRLKDFSSVSIFDGGVSELDCATDQTIVRSEAADPVTVKAVIAADGQNSICRKSAGISVTRWAYPQTAIVTSFAHSKPHKNISIEFHRGAGPLTTVPLPGKRSSLVWIETDEDAEDLAGLSDEAFAKRLTRETASALGHITDMTKRGRFHIAGSVARQFAKSRVFLVGETAHVIPPIGAQGLNLSLRDAALAVELIGAAHAAGEDIGGRGVLETYDRRRRVDVFPRQVAIDLLNRTLTSSFLPFQGARSLGLAALQSIGPLRRTVMQEGLAPTRGLPKVMEI
ncbi:MAG: FAD-dependent monooxygenase [Pseudomonadota bacterium]